MFLAIVCAVPVPGWRLDSTTQLCCLVVEGPGGDQASCNNIVWTGKHCGLVNRMGWTNARYGPILPWHDLMSIPVVYCR